MRDVVRVTDFDGGDVDIGYYALAERFFRLLKREALAGTPEPSGTWDADSNPSGDRALEIARVTLRRIVEVMNPRSVRPDLDPSGTQST